MTVRSTVAKPFPQQRPGPTLFFVLFVLFVSSWFIFLLKSQTWRMNLGPGSRRDERKMGDAVGSLAATNTAATPLSPTHQQKTAIDGAHTVATPEFRALERERRTRLTGSAFLPPILSACRKRRMLAAQDIRPDSAAHASVESEIAHLEHLARALSQGGDRDLATRLLIEAGALETAVADALSPEIETFGPGEAAWRATTMEAARLFRWSRLGREIEVRVAAKRFGRALAEAARSPRPPTVRLGAPEGYAGRALSPDAYLKAADQFLGSSIDLPAVVVGLRGAGASLSAVVAAGLEAARRPVESFTVRPHGPAEARTVGLGERLSRRLARQADNGAWFLIVGDGPKRSGASFAAAAAALNALGAGDDQIVLFPSIATDGAHFPSPEARRGWGLRRKVLARIEVRRGAAWEGGVQRDLFETLGA
jgi:hypothetical protein